MPYPEQVRLFYLCAGFPAPATRTRAAPVGVILRENASCFAVICIDCVQYRNRIREKSGC